jgi:hypothetical protein
VRIFDENYLKSHEVWVISLHDGKINPVADDINVEANGKVEAYNCLRLNENPCARSPAVGSTIFTYKYAIKCSKESALAGQSEVSITTWTCFKDFINPTTGQHEDVDWYGDPEYRLIRQVPRSLLGVCFDRYAFPVIESWLPITEPNPSGGLGDVLYYIVFEHDNWPTGLRYRTLTPFWFWYPNTPLTISFRSADGEYGSGVFSADEKCFVCAPGSGTTACDHRWENSCAEFTFAKSL